MKYKISTPQEFRGKLEAHLPQIARQLGQELKKGLRSSIASWLHLSKEEINVLSSIIVDFAADMHGGVGLWAAYEQFNTKTFGEALPLTGGSPSGPFCPDRVRHLLWKALSLFFEELVIDPHHGDIHILAKQVSAFLENKFAKLPVDAGEKRLILSSNDEGWEVKRKLVWLGTQSYMFRVLFWRYMGERRLEIDAISDAYARENRRIDYTDDFVCQECTLWSGLGPLDILAAVLDIPEAQRVELRSWQGRHRAVYRLDKVTPNCVEAVNLISEAPYVIRHASDCHSFDGKTGGAVFGATVPWRGTWYWSGTQHMLSSLSDPAVTEVIQQMKHKSSIVCRYWPEQEKAVREMNELETRRMLNFYGNDLKFYPDGLTMAADWEREFKAVWEAQPKEIREDAARRHGLQQERPNVSIPQHLLDDHSGLAVFIHPVEGKEIAVEADAFVSALKKRGSDLSDDEKQTVLGWILSDSISPEFINRMLKEYGGEESVKESFLLRDVQCEYWLDFLFRCYKGHYYRMRYPTLSVV